MPDYTGRTVSARRLRWGVLAVVGAFFASFGMLMLLTAMEVVLNSFDLGAVLGCAGFGVLLTAVGLPLLVVHRRWVHKIIRIRDLGRTRQAVVTRYLQTNATINGVIQFRLGLLLDNHTGESGMHPMWDLERHNIGSHVTVYVDPDIPGEMVWEGDCGLPDPKVQGKKPDAEQVPQFRNAEHVKLLEDAI